MPLRIQAAGAVAAVIAVPLAPARAQPAAGPAQRGVPVMPLALGGARPAAANYTGWSVAISGTTAIAGAPGVRNSAGVAHIYVRSSAGWHTQATLADPGRKAGDSFGWSVAVSGSTALISAPGATSGGAVGAGVVYVYVRSGSTWRRHATLADPHASVEDNFGNALAISGTTAIIGVTVGPAYIYGYSSGSWRRKAALADPAGGAYIFPASVGISGTTAIVGAYGAQKGPGAAFIYVRGSSGTWRQQAKVSDPVRTPYDYFGYAVAIAGPTAVVGAYGVKDESGEAFIYGRSGTAWHLHAKLRNPRGYRKDYFGEAVAASRTRLGTRVVIGAPNRKCGLAYDYSRPRTTWLERARIDAPVCYDSFAFAIALWRRTAIFGAPFGNAIYETAIP